MFCLGTPKTLTEAISNVFVIYGTANADKEILIKEIEAHVRDFLAQHMSVAMIKHEEAHAALDEFWNKIR